MSGRCAGAGSGRGPSRRVRMIENSWLLLSWPTTIATGPVDARSSPNGAVMTCSEGNARLPGAQVRGQLPTRHFTTCHGYPGLRRPHASVDRRKSQRGSQAGFLCYRRSTGRSETSGLVYPDDVLPRSGRRVLGDAGWSSPVARQAHNLKVVGSNPAPATN